MCGLKARRLAISAVLLLVWSGGAGGARAAHGPSVAVGAIVDADMRLFLPLVSQSRAPSVMLV